MYQSSRRNQFLISLSLLIGALVGTTTVLISLNQSQETRTPAEDTSLPQITVATDPAQPIAYSPVTLLFKINTKDYSVAGIQMNNLKIRGQNLINLPDKLDTSPESQFKSLINSLETVDGDTAKISFLTGLADLSEGYSSNYQTKTFAKFTLTPQNTHNITVDFDTDNTSVTQFGVNDQNILTTPQDVTFTIYEPGSVPSPNPCSVPETPPSIKANGGPNDGEIQISWVQTDNTDHYSISYGPKSREYQWGAANIGAGRDFIIRGLTPGKTYYIVISAVNSCGGSAFSSEVKASATGKVTPSVIPSLITPEIVYYNPSPIPQTPEPSASATASATPTEEPSPSPTPSPVKTSDYLNNPLVKILAGILAVIAVYQGIRFIRKNPPDKTSLEPESPPPSSTLS